MNPKKLLSILLVFCLVFSLAACGSRDVDDDDDDNGKKSINRRIDDEDDKDEKDKKNKKDDKGNKDKKDDEDDDDEDEDIEDNKDNGKDEEDNGRDDEDDKGSEDTGSDKDIFASFPKQELPPGYPAGYYPVYKGGHVWMGVQEDMGDHSRYTVAIAYNEEFDTIIDHYEGFLSNGKDYNKTASPFGNNYTGELGGYKFDIIIMGVEKEGDLVQASISLTEIPSAGSVLKSLDVAEIPDGYPINDFPIIDGGTLYNASESESGGIVSYTLEIFTDKTIKEIIKFYEDNLKDIADKSKTSDTDSFYMSGSSSGYYFIIQGYKSIENNVELNCYYIDISPVE